HFLRLQRPRPTPAAPDRDLALRPTPWAGAALERSRWDVARPVWLAGEQQRKALLKAAAQGRIELGPTKAMIPAVFVANAREVRRADAPPFPFPGGDRAVAPTS